jgi:glycosyltransferase involved in cell wall biosynthesis
MVGALPPPYGGIGQVTANYMRSQLATICDLSLFEGCRRREYTKRGQLDVVNIGLAVKEQVDFLSTVIRLRPHIVHIHTSSKLSFWRHSVLGILAKSLGACTILHIHGSGFDKYYRDSSAPVQSAIQWILSRMDGIFASSPYWKDFLCGLTEERRIFVVPNGVEIPPACFDKERPDSTVEGLFVGLWGERKGIYDLLDVMPSLLQVVPNFRLTLVGPPEDEGADLRVLEMIRARSLSDSVVPLGKVSEGRKREAFLSADMFVLPTKAEVMPVAILEAMAYGLPIVSTTVGAIPEVVVDGEGGILVNPSDTNSLLQGVVRLGQDPALRCRMGLRNRGIVSERYSVQTVVELTFQAYQKILERPNC